MDLPVLNLPAFQYQFKEEGTSKFIWDAFRKKWVRLTPEEWVRQHFAWYLVNELNFSASLISSETSLKSKDLAQRADLIAYNRNGHPLMLVECKAATVKLSQEVFDQAAVYGMQLNTKVLVLTNGLEHIACRMNPETKTFIFLDEIPSFEKLNHT